jgi:hypothetical protein
MKRSVREILAFPFNPKFKLMDQVVMSDGVHRPNA